MLNRLNPTQFRCWKVRFLFLVAVGIETTAFACDFDWQYIGSAGFISAIEDPLDSAVVRGGKYRAWDDPLGGGVYVHRDPDTTWAYGGLIGHRVFALRSFPYFRPGRIFASTDQGLYLFEEDTTWTLLNTVGIGGEGEQVDFVVSAYDTSLWLISTQEMGGGGFGLTRDGGQTWSFYANGRHPIFSRYDENTLYFTDNFLWRTNVSDSTFEFLGIAGDYLAYHPTQPWFYTYSLMFSRLGRFNEVTGDTLSIEIGTVARIDYAEGIGLIIDYGQLYLVSDDLSTWTACDDSISSSGIQLIYASSTRRIAGTTTRIYSSSVNGTSAANPNNRIVVTPINSYPNPAHGYLQLDIPVPGSAEMYNLLGQQLWQGNFDRSGTVSVSGIDALSAGTYFLRFTPLFNRMGSPSVKTIHVIK